MGNKIAELKQGSKKKEGLRYSNLCIHLDLGLPEGFKIPKFDHFNGLGDPRAYLRAYCDQLVRSGGNEALLMRLFSRSLSGTAMEWFISQDISRWKTWEEMTSSFMERFRSNVENVLDRFSLEKICRKLTETYREYASRWRDEATRVIPPMTEPEHVAAFIRNNTEATNNVMSCYETIKNDDEQSKDQEEEIAESEGSIDVDEEYENRPTPNL
ncbi:uncharacterized protein LOC132612900 [Lycium barbarum]|uniref:uncharacterized protein LOC132612900 n=1 Tax=Lycium barbarum TaxID=112863 RepID=UPI00293E369E|nr:uncharacterized protein LOC132612900 [Lycium barbarum]